MRETAAQAVLLVRAFEEADPSGRVLTLDERRRATDEAHAATAGAGSGPEDALAARAASLLAALEASVPGVPRLLSGTRLLAGLGPILVAGGLAVGLLVNELGTSRRVSLVPLLLVLAALVLWNLFVYVTLLVFALRTRRQDERPAASIEPSRPAGPASRVIEWVVGRFSRAAARQRVRETAIVTAAVMRFSASWRRAVAPLLASRARLAFHLGSLSLALGIVGGMYVRGLGFRYEAAWESTFLDAKAFHALAAAILGPAAVVTGRAVPSAADIAAATDAHATAAPWIFLYAATAFLFVIFPRSLLALSEGLYARRLAANVRLDLGAAYASRAGGEGAMPGAAVEVLPYSHHPAPRAEDALRALLHDVFGTKAEISVGEPLPYGCETSDVPPVRAAGPACRVLLVALAQTPESEVHGRLLRDLAAGRRHHDRFAVVGDASTYRERVGDATRVAERLRLWERIARESGASFVGVDLGLPQDAAAAAERLSAAVRGESARA